MARSSMAWLIKSLRLKVNDEGPAMLDPGEYYLGDSIKLNCTYRNGDGVIADPTSSTVNIWSPEGTKIIDSATPTKSGTGIYYYNYRIPETGPSGIWRAVFSGVVNGVIREYTTEFDTMLVKRIWTDDELQSYLDMHRFHIHRELLSQDIDSKTYLSSFGMFEDNTTLWNSDNSDAVEVTPDNSNLVDGVFVFNETQNISYYLDGTSYNIHAAVAECLEQLAMDPNKAREWTRGSIKYTHYDLMAMAKYHRNFSGPTNTFVVKTYRKH